MHFFFFLQMPAYASVPPSSTPGQPGSWQKRAGTATCQADALAINYPQLTTNRPLVGHVRAHVQYRRSVTVGNEDHRCGPHGGRGAKRTHPFTTTMLRPAYRPTRSAVRLLADSKSSQTLMLQSSRSLHEHTLVNLSLISQNEISAAPASVSIPRLQTRPFTLASRSSARHLRSNDRHRKVAVNPHLVDPTNDDLPRKGRKGNPFLPFQASSFVDAFATTIVSVGVSESNKHEHGGT